jgi:hypothetical protein
MKKVAALFTMMLASTALFGFDYNLNKGWNLAGSVEDLDLSQMPKNCVELVWICDQTWSKYDPNLNTNSFTTIKQGHGFWVKTDAICTISTSPSDTVTEGNIASITPYPLTLGSHGEKITFAVSIKDEDGNDVTNQYSFTWSSDNSVASITSTSKTTAEVTLNAYAAGTCATIEAQSTAGDFFLSTHVALEGSTDQYPCPPQ